MEKDKKKLESEIQSEICFWLLENKYFFWRCNVMPTYGRSRFLPKGLPDIAVVHEGVFYGIEVKRVERPTPITDSQKEIAARILEVGGKYYIVHSLEDVKSIFSSIVSPYFS